MLDMSFLQIEYGFEACEYAVHYCHSFVLSGIS